jgi:SNF2 family DNA or RNA helicase
MYQFSDGEIVDGELAIVRLLRFQQVLCNYVPTDGSPKRQIAAKNPRLNLMEEIRDETHRPAIIWARFTSDVDQLMDLLGNSAVRYDGAVTADEAERAKAAFQAGDAKWFVGTAQKGGPGLTLTQAKSVIYYSNSFKLVDRLQSEDRAHRAGMDEHPVNIIDLICAGTVDERIVQSLRDKREISAQVLGDEIREWL